MCRAAHCRLSAGLRPFFRSGWRFMLAQIAGDPGADQEGADHRGSQDDLASQRDGPPAVQDVRRCRHRRHRARRRPGTSAVRSLPPAGGATVRVEAGFPVTAAIHADGDVASSELPGGPVAQALASWVTRQGGGSAGDLWETYAATRPGNRIRPPGAPRLPSPTTRHEAALLTELSGTRVTLLLPGRPWGASTWSCHCSRGSSGPADRSGPVWKEQEMAGSPSVSTVRTVLSGLLSRRCARQPSVMLR